jgi:hypothetical protein
MVGGVFVAMKTIRERGGRFLALTLLSGKVADAALWNCTTFSAVPAFTFTPFICGALCGMNAGNKIRRRGWRAVRKEVVLDPSSSPSMYQVPLNQEQLSIRFAFLVVQLYPLTFDILFLGDLRAHSVDVSYNPRVDNRDKSVVDKTAVD